MRSGLERIIFEPALEDLTRNLKSLRWATGEETWGGSREETEEENGRKTVMFKITNAANAPMLGDHNIMLGSAGVFEIGRAHV